MDFACNGSAGLNCYNCDVKVRINALIFLPLCVKIAMYFIEIEIERGRKPNMTSKQRAYLKSLAMTQDAIFQIGKSSLTPENTKAIDEALEARELIKISVLQNCMDDPAEIARMAAERTKSQIVQVIGKKIVLYREGKNDKKKIQLP